MLRLLPEHGGEFRHKQFLPLSGNLPYAPNVPIDR